MQSSVQTGGRSASPLSRSKSNTEHPPSPAYSASGRTKKRDRSDKSVDSSKKKRSAEPPEISSLVDKDGGLVNISAVDGLYLLMQQDLNKSSRKLKDVALRRTTLAAVISSTVRDDCLKKFVQLGGLSLLNDWLQDAHKGKLGDGGISEESDRTIDDLILILLQALEKLPVDLDALKTSNAGKSVKSLRSHADSKIHRKAKKLVDAWKRIVNAEMKQSEEAKTGSKQDVSRPYKPVIPKDSPGVMKNGGSLDANLRSSGAFGNVVKNTTTTNSSSMGEAAIYLKKGGAALSTSGGASTKESPSRMQLSNSPPGETDGVSVPDERSSNSNQPLNNGGLWSTAPKGSVSNAVNTKVGNSRSHITSKGANAGSKEAGLGKPLSRSASTGIDKKPVVPACEKISNESIKVEASANNQRLILRIPNNARNSLSSSFADAAVPSSKDSSSNVAERTLELKDRKSRLQNTPTENASMKTSSSRHDDVEKHADVPKRRNEMDCHSSESYMSFSSTECCTLDYKKSHQFQEGQQANEMTHDPVKNNCSRSNGCGNEDINAGISLLASIAADENLRIEANAALTAFEEQRNAKDSENQHQGARTACLTDSENSPMSGITENSGRIEVAPEADVKDAQGNCDYLKPGSSEGTPNLGISAGALDTDLGHSDENVRTSEGNSSETKPSGGKAEGTCCMPSETRPRSPSGRLLDDSRCNENEVTLHTAKDFSAAEGNGVEEKETPLHANSGAASLVDASSAGLKIYGKAGEEMGEKKNGATSIPKEFAYEIPGEDAIEVAMQVAKEATMQVVTEVKEEMENRVKVSVESDDKMATNLGHKKAVPSIENLVSERHTWESIDQKNDEKDDAGDKRNYIGVKEEKMNYSEDKEAEQTCTYPSFEGRPIKNLGTEDLDERLRESSSSNESKMQMHNVQLQNSSYFTAVEPKETVKAELSSYLEAPGKLRFDLNEGIHLEESPHETITAVSYPIASIPITPVAFHPVNSSSLSGIIPPPSVLQGKGELGWKGSAATSAFRPAEPRKIPESCQNATESTAAHVPSASVSKPAQPLFDFDLNIAEEEPIDEASKPNHTTQNSSSSRLDLDLDLNRLDESEENGAVLASELASTELHSSAKISKTIKHDFDLNAGLGMDDTATADPADPHRNSWIPGYGNLPFSGFKMGSEMVSLHPSWNQLGSTFSSPPIPSLAQVRQDTPFSASMSPAFFNVGQGQSIPAFHPEMCRPSAEPLSSTASALPYPMPHSSAFQYAGYNLGFTSAPFPASASFMDSSGSASYAPMAPPFLTSGAIHASPSRYNLPGFSEIAVSSNIWASRPSLDLNAGPSFDLNSGPEHTDADVREDRTAMRQATVFPSTFPLEQKTRVLRQSGDPSDTQKRKESEAAWDLYRTDAVPELTDVNIRDERLRQMPVFGNQFSIDEHYRPLRQPEPVESLKRKEPEGSWEYRGGMKHPTWR